MGNNQTYKNRALNTLDGEWSTAAIASLIVFVITGGVGSLISMPFDTVSGQGVSSLWTLLCIPLDWGFAVFFLNMARRSNISYERLFDGYKDFIRIFLAGFLVELVVIIGCVLFIVPGIIAALMFSQTSYILKDDTEISASDAMKKSMAMMQGHKMELFLLTLSFIGWAILACLTLGIGFLFLAPYIDTTLAHYYEDLKAEYAA